MRKPYCCESSRHLFDQYYKRQQNGGGDFPVYVGRQSQRGHGLGNIIGSLFRRILPFLKSFAPHVLRTGANIVEDVSKGKSWKDATFERVPETISKFAFNQSGSGVRRKKKAKKRKLDIFS